MPVKAMAMPYLSQVSMTLSSRMEPPGWAMNSTPDLWARSMLSPKGKKASLPRATPVMPESHSRRSSRVNSSGFSVKNCCQAPSRSTSMHSSPM